ncbi:MAG: hypothetical protein RMY16_27090 [Nostoc sp. DedQUE12b]|nr:hypothetical protein [Nostoc sp. DedQUE12b]
MRLLYSAIAAIVMTNDKYLAGHDISCLRTRLLPLWMEETSQIFFPSASCLIY